MKGSLGKQKWHGSVEPFIMFICKNTRSHGDEQLCGLMSETNDVWYWNISPMQQKLEVLEVGGRITPKRLRGSLVYSRIWSAEEHDFNERRFNVCHYRRADYLGVWNLIHTRLLRGWNLQQTSIRACERSTGMKKHLLVLMMLTEPVCFISLSLWVCLACECEGLINHTDEYRAQTCRK